MSERLIRKTEGISAPSKRQLREIKRLMFWPRDKRFPRCPAKVKKFVKDCEANGDFTHSVKGHICDECRCKKRAGQGTKGDFYGIGIETGHLGVGWCVYHDMSHPNVKALEFADNELRLIQQVGDAQKDSKSYLKNVEADAKLAQMSLRARQDLELVVDTLNTFKDRMQRKDLTEMTKKGPVQMSDATEIKLSLDIAKTLSRIKLDHFKLDSNSYLHYDELQVRIPRMMNLCTNCFEELREMVMAGEENPVQRINEKLTEGFRSIWSDVKTGARD